MEFPKGRSRKNHVEFPWVLVIFLEIPMGRTHFCGTSQGENLHFVLNFPLFGFVLVTACSVSSAINNIFDEWQLRASWFPESFGQGKFSSWSYHKSNLLLSAQETMQLLVNQVNHWLIMLVSIVMQPKSISLEQFCCERCQGVAVTSLALSSFFNIKKQTPKTNLEKSCQYIAS